MFILVVCLFAIPLHATAQNATPPPLPYFGLVPTDSVQFLAPEFISTGSSERDGCFTADGREFYYTVWTGSFGAIVSTRLGFHGWTSPEVVPFSGRYSDLEAFIAPDGNRMYFSSNRPLRGDGPPKDYDIWYVDRLGTSWGEPVNVGAPVNSPKDEFYPSVTRNGTLYVTAEYDSGAGGEDIYRFERRESGFGPAQNLGSGVNTAKGEFNAFVDPEERFLIFSSFGRADQLGGGDLYVSWRLGDGTWGPARILGPEVNSRSLDYCPWVSADGRMVLFSSRRQKAQPYLSRPLTLRDLKAIQQSAGNGQGDICIFNASKLFEPESRGNR